MLSKYRNGFYFAADYARGYTEDCRRLPYNSTLGVFLTDLLTDLSSIVIYTTAWCGSFFMERDPKTGEIY